MSCLSISGCLCTDVLVIFVGLLTAIYAYFKWRYNYWEKRGIPYLEPTIPFGNLGSFFSRNKVTIGLRLSEIYKELKSKGHKYGGIYTLTQPRFVPVDLDLIKNIMSKDFNHFTDRGVYVNEEDDPLSAHLFSLSGQKWKNLRQKLTPTFTSGKMKMMFQTLVDCSAELKVLMDKLTARQEPVDIKEILGRFTTDIIGSCAFGLECNSLKDPDAEFRKHGRMIFDNTKLSSLKRLLIVTNPKLAKFFRMTINKEEVTKFFMGAVKDTVEYREKNNISRKDFLQLLLDLKHVEKTETSEAGTTLTMNELAAQAFVFFIAGFETSSTTMTFCLYELATNPDIQEKVRKEVEQVLAKHDGKITYDAIMEMHYMEQVVNETLRKYPPVPILHRQCTEDYKIPDSNFTLRKGDAMFIPVLGIQYDPEYYPDPEKFDPERFSEENKQTRHHFTHLPFGEGPRVCIGLRFGMMQTKVGLSVLLKNYKFTLNPKTERPIKFDNKSFILSTEGGVWLTSHKL